MAALFISGCSGPKTVVLVNASANSVEVDVERHHFKIPAYGSEHYESHEIMGVHGYGPLELRYPGKQKEVSFSSGEVDEGALKEKDTFVIVLHE